MSDLETIQSWIATYSATQQLQSLVIDYYAPQKDNSLQPAGLTELSRTQNVWGIVTTENQYCFGLYYTLLGDVGADTNTQWVLGFQKWIQEQSARQLAPFFGDEPETERITAGNGALYEVGSDGTVTYLLQLTVNFKRIYEI